MASNQKRRYSTLENDDQSRNGCVVEVEGAQISLNTQTLTEILSDTTSYLGEGYFADVYRFVCPASNKTVALKHLRNATLLKAEKCKDIAQKFLREIRVHRDLDHQNILKFFGSIENKKVGKHGGIFLIIQYAEKGSLTDIMIETEDLERNKMLIYIEQILQGLSYLHNYTNKLGQRQPIAHRDLRCHNVLMMEDGTLKIADFGLCKRLNELAAASGIGSQTGNAYWTGPEFIKSSKDLPASTLVLTDIWSLGVLILELYYYGAHRIPFTSVYSQMEYGSMLGDGWGPKIPENAPEEIKTLLRQCFQYTIEDRTSAENLLNTIGEFDSKRKANLAITSRSTSDNTLNSRSPPLIETPNGLEIDPLAEMDDTKYLTRLHEPTTLISSSLSVTQHNNIIKSITQKELNRYIAKDAEEFILEDFFTHDATYHVKRKEDGEIKFRVFFRSDGKVLSVRCQRNHKQAIFTIDSSNKRNRCLSASLAGGIFAKVNEPNGVKRTFWTNLRMEVNSISEEGAKTLTAMSPMNRKRLVTVPGSSSEGSPDSIYCTAKESLTGSLTEFTFDDRNVDVKKSKHKGYNYTIRYREFDKEEIGYFNTFVEKGKCEILVTPGSNTALVATVVAYYYQQKRKRVKRSKWREKLSKKSSSSKNGFSDDTPLTADTP